MLEHANVGLWSPLDRLLTLVWVTPGMHKLHHSRDREQSDSNYGNLLAIPDRVFGTFTPSGRGFGGYGLEDADPERARSFPRLLEMPFVTDQRARRIPSRASDVSRSGDISQPR